MPRTVGDISTVTSRRSCAAQGEGRVATPFRGEVSASAASGTGDGAAEKAGTFEVDKVRTALIGEKFKGPAGEVTMQENHHLINNVYIGETLPTGQFKIIKTFTAVAGEPFSEKFLK